MMMKELSIATSFNYDIPLVDQLPLIADAGFTHVSLGAREPHANYLSPTGRRALKALLADTGLRIDTIHGPRADQTTAGAELVAVAEAAVELAAPTVVFHASPFYYDKDKGPAFRASLQRTCETLRPVAERTGIVFAIENVLPGPPTELVREALGELDPQYFGLCYDSSHDQIDGPRPFDLLADLRTRVAAVHLSDRVREFVDHLIPGDGFINWEELAQAVRQTAFPGPLLFEVLTTHSPIKETKPFLNRAYEQGSRIYQLIYEHGGSSSI
jgi:sugar phosphate isomerase/epimerase